MKVAEEGVEGFTDSVNGLLDLFVKVSDLASGGLCRPWYLMETFLQIINALLNVVLLEVCFSPIHLG